MSNPVFEEAQQVLDGLSVDYAQFIQERLRAGLIDGRYYNHAISDGCTTCFYGAICLYEGKEKFWSEIEPRYLALADNFIRDGSPTLLEEYLSDYPYHNTHLGQGIYQGATPENNQRAKELDEFLTDYIHARLSASEVTCAVLPLESHPMVDGIR